jgi:capsular polysaccharide biosynthesis protein
LLEDLVYVSQADVLLGLHGDSLYWAFFMTKHSHVVEIRPRGFAGPQANQHMKVRDCCLSAHALQYGAGLYHMP